MYKKRVSSVKLVLFVKFSFKKKNTISLRTRTFRQNASKEVGRGRPSGAALVEVRARSVDCDCLVSSVANNVCNSCCLPPVA